MTQSQLTRHGILVHVILWELIARFTDTACVVLFPNVNWIIGVDERLTLGTSRRWLREYLRLWVIERAVVEGLWDGCSGLEWLGVGKGVPDETDRVPLLLLFDLHIIILPHGA